MQCSQALGPIGRSSPVVNIGSMLSFGPDGNRTAKGKKEPEHWEHLCMSGPTLNMEQKFSFSLHNTRTPAHGGTAILVLFTDMSQAPKSVLRKRQAINKYVMEEQRVTL